MFQGVIGTDVAEQWIQDLLRQFVLANSYTTLGVFIGYGNLVIIIYFYSYLVVNSSVSRKFFSMGPDCSAFGAHCLHHLHGLLVPETLCKRTKASGRKGRA